MLITTALYDTAIVIVSIAPSLTEDAFRVLPNKFQLQESIQTTTASVINGHLEAHRFQQPLHHLSQFSEAIKYTVIDSSI
jgi:hypothetical protein